MDWNQKQILIFIVSTTGDGVPPINMKVFLNFDCRNSGNLS